LNENKTLYSIKKKTNLKVKVRHSLVGPTHHILTTKIEVWYTYFWNELEVAAGWIGIIDSIIKIHQVLTSNSGWKLIFELECIYHRVFVVCFKKLCRPLKLGKFDMPAKSDLLRDCRQIFEHVENLF